MNTPLIIKQAADTAAAKPIEAIKRGFGNYMNALLGKVNVDTGMLPRDSDNAFVQKWIKDKERAAMIPVRNARLLTAAALGIPAIGAGAYALHRHNKNKQTEKTAAAGVEPTYTTIQRLLGKNLSQPRDMLNRYMAPVNKAEQEALARAQQWLGRESALTNKLRMRAGALVAAPALIGAGAYALHRHNKNKQTEKTASIGSLIGKGMTMGGRVMNNPLARRAILGGTAGAAIGGASNAAFGSRAQGGAGMRFLNGSLIGAAGGAAAGGLYHGATRMGMKPLTSTRVGKPYSQGYGYVKGKGKTMRDWLMTPRAASTVA